MEFKVLASGSKGNCSFVTCGTTSFLIDIGITYHRLLRELDRMGVCLSDVSFLLLTHTHRDHISGLSVLLKHSQFRVYIREEMYPELKDILPLDRIEFYQDEMHLNGITLNLIHTSHDAPGSVGFLFTYLEHSLVYITDTGYLNRKYLKLLKNKEIYYIEEKVYVDRYHEDTGEWGQIDAWMVEDANDYFVYTGKTITVDRGYYYRVHADHFVQEGDDPMEETFSLTNGIMVP